MALLCPVIREAEIGGCVLAGMCERERECVSMCVGGACALSVGVLTLQGQGRSSHVSVAPKCSVAEPSRGFRFTV